MKKIFSSLFLLAVFMSTSAQADDQIERIAQVPEGTIHVVHHRVSANGLLTACELEFSALGRDFSTKLGAPVKIVGSFSLRQHPKIGMGYMLKIGVFDGLDMKSAITPHHAYMRSPNGNATKNSVKSKSDTKGFALFMGAFDEDVLAAYESVIENRQLVIGFNRKLGQQDVTMKIDLSVVSMKIGSDGQAVRQRSYVPVNEFLECTSELMKGVQATIK